MQRSFGTEISGNRGRSCELSPLARAGIIAKHEAGCTHKEIAQEFSCAKRTVIRTINRWKNHNTVTSLPRSGRPEVLNRAQKRAVVRFTRRLPKVEYIDLQKETETKHVSRATLYRLLKKHSITKYRAKRRPKLDRDHTKLRLRFSRKHRNFNFRRQTVKFSDKYSI
jgi:transposase